MAAVINPWFHHLAFLPENMVTDNKANKPIPLLLRLQVTT